MKWLLDTNVLSELRKRDRIDARVRAWFDSVPEPELCTSALVIGELRRGVESIGRRDGAAGVVLEKWLLRLTSEFGRRVLPVDAVVADRWGRLSVPDPIATVDGLLAATALTYDLTLVTRNVRDVVRTGARVLDPFAG